MEYPLISAVLGSAFESWEWYEEVTFAEGFDWDIHPLDKKTKLRTCITTKRVLWRKEMRGKR